MNVLKCDNCGRFISYTDIENDLAMVAQTYPSSHFTNEEYETLCKVCFPLYYPEYFRNKINEN